jgi:hypothetical protein
MGYASGRTHARLAEDQKSSSLLCLVSLICAIETLLSNSSLSV